MIGFYTFSFQNPLRKQRLEERFSKESIQIEFVKCVEQDDVRLENTPVNIKRNWAIMWNHLDMLKVFLESDNKYGVFCEDDILIRKKLKSYLPELIEAYNRRNLDILLLSYLTQVIPVGLFPERGFKSSETNLIYLEYEDSIWGAHMYMIDRKTAKKFINLYNVEYAKNTLLTNDTPFFSPDWTLTKKGKRALVYPMMGIEEGQVATDDIGQIEFHKKCHKIHYDPLYYY